MKYFIIVLLLISCATLDEDVLKTKAQPKYQVGQCYNVFDPETGKVNPKDIVRIEAIGQERYYYRWWTYLNEWALEINTGIGKFEVFERMTSLVDCPKEKTK